MILRVYTDKLKGNIKMISSKSFAHRALICSAFSSGKKDSFMRINEISKDILATLFVLESIGFEYEKKDDLIILKKNEIKKDIDVNFFESGSTYRFFLPILASLGIKGRIFTSESLMKRPISELIEELKNHDIKFSDNNPPFTMEGKLRDYLYEIPGDKTSQYLSGFLLASPLIDSKNDIKIKLNSGLSSASYVDITMDVMKEYNVNVDKKDNIYTIREKEYIDSSTLENPKLIEGDWSNAIFYIVGGLINGDITISNLNIDSIQGDRKIVDTLIKMGGKIKLKDSSIHVMKSELKGGLIDLDNIPDSFPILAILASQTKEGIKFINYSRLKYKESNRIASTLEMIENFGGRYKLDEEYIEILPSKLFPGRINSFNDHRIQMAASIASLVSGEVFIEGVDSFKKSYPSFYKDFLHLGGKYEFI